MFAFTASIVFLFTHDTRAAYLSASCAAIRAFLIFVLISIRLAVLFIHTHILKDNVNLPKQSSLFVKEH